jgi:hypothetical protein
MLKLLFEAVETAYARMFHHGVLALVAIFVALAVLYWTGPTATEHVVDTLLAKGYVAQANATELEEALKFLTVGTPFENHWQVNKPLRDAWLNAYIISIPKDQLTFDLPELQRLRANCAFIGDPHVIVCDADFIATFLRRRGGSFCSSEDMFRTHPAALLLWILGHELGHIHYGDKPPHFEANALERSIGRDSAQSDELAADLFSVQRIASDMSHATAVSRLLHDVLNNEIAKKVGNVPAGVGILFDYNNKKIVEYTSQDTHPEYVVRCARMIRLIAELTGDEGTANQAREFEAHMRPAARQPEPSKLTH